MELQDLVHAITRAYVDDQQGVSLDIVQKVDGYRRSKNIAKLSSCSSLFDWAQHSVKEWRFTRQIEAFYKKNALFAHSASCEQAARTSFFDAEKACKRTNARLSYVFHHESELHPVRREHLRKMRRYISSVLGPFIPFLDALPDLVRVTPGATSHSSRRNSLPQLKMRMSLYASNRAWRYLNPLYQFFGFKEPRIKTTTSNRVELVPKNWKTDRTIACEPEGNLPFQLAFDSYAKKRLRMFGINLSNQFANQKAAKKASITNLFATVDFKAASDTISFEVVQLLFPKEWFNFLYDVRTPCFRGVFGEGAYQKFSSMGNGSTFTIETLLFAAACYAVGSKDFLVYGDDVIIESEKFKDYERLAAFLGFVINTDKTYVDSPFRESCGLDAFNGIDVTPVYIRSLDNRKASYCHLINTVAGLCIPGGNLEALLTQLVTEKKLPLVPYQENTLSGIWIDPDTARSLRVLRCRNWIHEFKSYVPTTKTRKFVDVRGYYLWFLNKNRQVLFGGPWELSRSVPMTQTASVPIFQHKYVRKWVRWSETPAQATPVHIYSWTEHLTRALGRR